MSPFQNKLGSFFLSPSLQFPNFGSNFHSPLFASSSPFISNVNKISLSNLASSFPSFAESGSVGNFPTNSNESNPEQRSFTPTSIHTLETLTPRSTVYRNLPFTSSASVISSRNHNDQLSLLDIGQPQVPAAASSSALASPSRDDGDNFSIGNDSQFDRELMNINVDFGRHSSSEISRIRKSPDKLGIFINNIYFLQYNNFRKKN
jgi:hypothetical protein